MMMMTVELMIIILMVFSQRICCSSFFISGNFHFSFVSSSLAYITIPKNKAKTKLPKIKN